MSLSSIYAEYVNSHKVEKERDPMRLFLSDLGKCPREVAYRLMGTTQDPRTEQQDINSTIMFDLAEHIEFVLSEALGDDVIAYQPDAPISDVTPQYENWGGRADLIAVYLGRRVIEVKTIYPGAFNYDLTDRYPQHHLQAKSYDIYFKEMFELDALPLLSYWDRGGQNTPVEVDATLTDNDVFREMDKMEMTRDMVPDLPDRLPKVLNLRSWGKQIILEPDGRCKSPYCKYTLTCMQDMSTSCMAVRNNTSEPWEMKKASRGYEDMVEEFATKLAAQAMEDM